VLVLFKEIRGLTSSKNMNKIKTPKETALFLKLILMFSLEESLVIYNKIIIMPLKKTIISIYLIQVEKEFNASKAP